MGVIKYETRERIYQYLKANPNSNCEEVTKGTGDKESTVYRHLIQLLDLGIICREKTGRIYSYSVIEEQSDLTTDIEYEKLTDCIELGKKVIESKKTLAQCARDFLISDTYIHKC